MKTKTFLLLGEPGVGKTLLIKSCANYLQRNSLEEAMRSPISIEDDFSFQINERGERIRLNFIEKRTLDLKEIEELAKSDGGINAVCLLIRSSFFDLKTEFRGELMQLLAKLNLGRDELFFCFTNTAPTGLKPGNSLGLLKNYLIGLRDKNRDPIKAEEENIFCFANDSYQYLGSSDQSFSTQSTSKSWSHSQAEIKRLLEKISANGSSDSDVSKNEPIDNLSPDLFDNFDQETNILVLGNRGVGKTTFINAMANYLRSKTMKEAKEKPIVLSNIKFEYRDEELCSQDIFVEPTIKLTQEEINNENLKYGEVTTQKPITYKFLVGPKNRKKIIRVIDSSGIAGWCRPSSDQKHIADIMQAVAQLYDIKAILFLLGCNERKLSPEFRFCLDVVFKLFPNTAKNNILYCFTGTADCSFRPGDTIDLLRKYLEEQKKENPSMKLTLDRSKVFCFESDWFRYICASMNGIQFSDYMVEIFNRSYRFSIKETARLFQQISLMPNHPTKEILNMFKMDQTLALHTRMLIDCRQKNDNKKTKRIKELCTDLDLFLKNHRMFSNFMKSYAKYLAQQIQFLNKTFSAAPLEELRERREELESMVEICNTQLELTADAENQMAKSSEEIWLAYEQFRKDFPELSQQAAADENLTKIDAQRNGPIIIL